MEELLHVGYYYNNQNVTVTSIYASMSSKLLMQIKMQPFIKVSIFSHLPKKQTKKTCGWKSHSSDTPGTGGGGAEGGADPDESEMTGSTDNEGARSGSEAGSGARGGARARGSPI